MSGKMKYLALVRRVPRTFSAKALRSNPDAQVNQARAEQQFDRYVETLRGMEINILELEEDDNYPDSVFVEDCAVVINETALICRPGVDSRLGEENSVRQALMNIRELNIMEMENAQAKLDGGDVLFTGQEIFVGISSRTNMAGAQAVAKTFVDFAVTPVHVPPGVLHLKQCITVIHENVLAVGSSDNAKKMFAELQKHSSFGYYVVYLNNDYAANVLFANGKILHLSKDNIPEDWRIFESKFNYSGRVETDLDEFLKVDGDLTGLSVIIPIQRNPKYFQSTLRRGQHDLWKK